MRAVFFQSWALFDLTLQLMSVTVLVVLVRRCSVVGRNIGHRSWRTRRCELYDEHEVGDQHTEKLTVDTTSSSLLFCCSKRKHPRTRPQPTIISNLPVALLLGGGLKEGERLPWGDTRLKLFFVPEFRVFFSKFFLNFLNFSKFSHKYKF